MLSPAAAIRAVAARAGTTTSALSPPPSSSSSFSSSSSTTYPILPLMPFLRPAAAAAARPRFASTAAAAATAPAPAPPVPAPAPTAAASVPPHPHLDWNGFFRLRTIRRRYQLAFSAAGLATGTATGLGAVASGAADPVVAVVPLDPMFGMGLVALASGALGWLGGPALGTVLFNMIHGGGPIRDQIMAKETGFFARVKRHRVDPSSSSTSNPVPDFYGERIQSVQGYRQWLRDQRAFDRKRKNYL